jgi:hypothetical protein
LFSFGNGRLNFEPARIFSLFPAFPQDGYAAELDLCLREAAQQTKAQHPWRQCRPGPIHCHDGASSSKAPEVQHENQAKHGSSALPVHEPIAIYVRRGWLRESHDGRVMTGDQQ